MPDTPDPAITTGARASPDESAHRRTLSAPTREPHPDDRAASPEAKATEATAASAHRT